MTVFDSHAHFPAASHAEHAVQIARAQAAGVSALLAVGGSPGLDPGAEAMARQFPGTVFLALGHDRDCAATLADTPAHLAGAMKTLRGRLHPLAEDGVRPVAIGETGLDFSHDPSDAERAAQCALFEANLLLSAELGLPCTIHSRDAADETLAILDRCGSKSLREAGRLGVIHCFTGDAAFAAGARSLGLMIGVSGILTFRNADALRATLAAQPSDRLLVETDCPYLTPVPLRGQVNEPAHVVHTVRRLAEVLGLTEAACAAATTSNAHRLFATGGD